MVSNKGLLHMGNLSYIHDFDPNQKRFDATPKKTQKGLDI
jgi:hypothetical protein